MFKERCLAGEAATVTAGGTGLGLSMARRFAELGVNLCLTSRDPDHLEPAEGELRKKG